MIPTKEVFSKLGTGVAIRKMHYLLTDKLQSKKPVGSLNMIFRAWLHLTSRIGD